MIKVLSLYHLKFKIFSFERCTCIIHLSTFNQSSLIESHFKDIFPKFL